MIAGCLRPHGWGRFFYQPDRRHFLRRISFTCIEFTEFRRRHYFIHFAVEPVGLRLLMSPANPAPPQAVECPAQWLADRYPPQNRKVLRKIQLRPQKKTLLAISGTVCAKNDSLTFPLNLAVINLRLIVIRVETIWRIRWERGIGFNSLLNLSKLVFDLLQNEQGVLGSARDSLRDRSFSRTERHHSNLPVFAIVRWNVLMPIREVLQPKLTE